MNEPGDRVEVDGKTGTVQFQMSPPFMDGTRVRIEFDDGSRAVVMSEEVSPSDEPAPTPAPTPPQPEPQQMTVQTAERGTCCEHPKPQHRPDCKACRDGHTFEDEG